MQLFQILVSRAKKSWEARMMRVFSESDIGRSVTFPADSRTSCFALRPNSHPRTVIIIFVSRALTYDAHAIAPFASFGKIWPSYLGCWPVVGIGLTTGAKASCSSIFVVRRHARTPSRTRSSIFSFVRPAIRRIRTAPAVDTSISCTK